MPDGEGRMMDDETGPVADLLGEVARTAAFYKEQPPTSARTALVVLPAWFLDSDVDEARVLADEIARRYGFKDARIERAEPWGP